MTLLNPFMPYLNPRASGLIVFKGNDNAATAEEVDTSVQTGVQEINTNTNEGFAAAEVALDNTNAAVQEVGGNVGQASDTGMTSVATGSFTTPVVEQQVINDDGSIGTELVGGDVVEYGGGEVSVTDTVKGDTEQIIGGQARTDDLINKRFDNFQPTRVVTQSVDTSDLAKADAMAQGFATSEANQAGIQGSIDEGFASVGSDLAGLSTGQSDIRTDISDLSGNMGTRFDAVDSSLNKGFGSVTDTVNTRFDTQDANLSDMSKNILSGQTSLQSYLEEMSGRADTYYGGLAEGQAGIRSSVGGLQDNFSAFETQYKDDTSLANQARANLAKQVTGGFATVQDNLDRNFDATSRQNADITRNTQQTIRNQDQMANTFGESFRQISSGMQAQSSSDQNAKQDMLQRLNTIREVILAEGQNLDPELTMQYAKLADSFDAEGRLIPQSTDKSGNVTQRGFDPNNNLNLATFNAQGSVVDQARLDIDQLMRTMDQLGYQGSTGTGLMSNNTPFATSIM